MKIHRKRQKSAKISIFSTFCGQFWAIFQPKSANIPLKAAYWIMSSVFVERLSTFWHQNDSKSTQVAQKRRCWNVSIPLESLWSVFEAKPCNLLFKKCNAKLAFVLSCLCWNLERVSRKMDRNFIKNDKNFKFFDSSGSIWRIIFHKLKDERSPIQHVCPCLGVFTF